MKAKRSLLMVVSAVIVSFAGCQNASTSEVTGKVMYKNAALKNGEVSVKSDSGVEASGIIGPDGTFTIKNAPRGKLKVRVFCTDEAAMNEYYAALAGRGKGEPKGPDGKVQPKGAKPFEPSDFAKIPGKYFDYDKSGLTMEIKDAKETKDITLE